MSDIVNQKLVCTVCDSDDVESKVWYNHKTGISTPTESRDSEDYYCNNCEEHVLLKYEDM
jgi:hypothetical protein